MSKKSLTYDNYDKNHYVETKGYEAHVFTGYKAISEKLKQVCEKENIDLIVCDLYPGVNEDEIISGLSALNPKRIIRSDDYAYDERSMTQKMEKWLTDDRVFGILTTDSLQDYFYGEKIKEAREMIYSRNSGLILIVGVGASLLTDGSMRKITVFFDMERWEIQLRYRRGMSNWKCDNKDDDILLKYKRGYFVEWRLADKHKKSIWENIDYYADTSTALKPLMIKKTAIDEALKTVVRRPFRTVPYFDPGVWGGQWMRRNFALDKGPENYAWSFDGVPEENSLHILFGGTIIKTPAQNLVLFHPHELLGEHVHGRFGTEFPIRFDLLDTMEGQNLSLQVHPLTEYIQEKFNMRYTQDESYYILDTGEEETYVYLGLKTGIDKKEMIHDLYMAQNKNTDFNADKYINKIPVKKHDHVMIPAGTVHCSGKNTMVLEISATPYIFTFKLWDWGRSGLDGIPRPIHLEHGIHNIQWDRNTEWVKENLQHQNKILEEKESHKIERTGLHIREFIETHRYTFNEFVVCNTNDSVNMLNLVEGAELTVESIDKSFEPFVVHYAETFIIPACIGTYIMRTSGMSEGKTIMVIQAMVR
jgi:mannose-6-phosphate isomerase class I